MGTIREKQLAVEAMGNIGNPGAEEIILPLLESDNRQLRLSAVWALGQLKSNRAAEQIVWMLGSENDPRVDGALVNIGDAATKWLKVKLKLASMMGAYDEGIRIARIMVDIQSPEGLAEVAWFLSDLLSDSSKSGKAREMLSQIGDKAVEPLIISLKNTNDEKLKINILRTLALIGNQKALNTFYSYVSDPNPTIRSIVANALGKIKADENTDFLIAMLRDTNEEVRTQAIISLGELRDTRSVVYLLSSLEDESPIIRAMAAYSLGMIQDVRAVYPLINLLDDKTTLTVSDPTTGETQQAAVSDFAAKALIKINDPRGIEALKERGFTKYEE